MSILVWGKFQLPSAKAAPKFVLAEEEGKWLCLPAVLPQTVPAYSGEEAVRREPPRAQQGRITARDGMCVSLSQLSPAPCEHRHHPAND